MAGCPFKNFEDCPQHNKKGGCELWLSYITNRNDMDAKIEGCSLVLTPMLLIENVNNLQVAANETRKVASEISKARCEAIKENMANRQQLVSLASGRKDLINVNHNLISKEDK